MKILNISVRFQEKAPHAFILKYYTVHSTMYTEGRPNRKIKFDNYFKAYFLVYLNQILVYLHILIYVEVR